MGLGHGGTHWIAATFYLLLPFITRDLGLSYVQAGALVSLFHASAFATNFASGLVVDMSGRRVLFQVTSLLMGGGALLAFGLRADFVLLCGLVVLIGVSNNLWHPAAIAFLSERYPRSRGYALSIHAFGANLGDTLAPLAVGAILVGLSWQGTAVTSALPAMAIALLIAVLLFSKDRPVADALRQGTKFAEYVTGVKLLLRDRAVLGLCLMAGFRSMAQNGLLMFLPLYLANELKVGPLAMGVAIMGMQLGGMLAAPMAGTWSDRVGRRPVVLSGLTVSSAVIAVLTLIGSEALFVVAVAVLGFALFAVRPVIHSWLMDLTPGHLAGTATSILFGMQSALSVLVPTVGGVIADTWGLPAVFYLLAATMLLANVLVYMLSHHEAAAARATQSGD
jgi:sugar phosphate permease